MKTQKITYDSEEIELLDEIENGRLIEKTLSKKDMERYRESAKYTKSLLEKKQTTIRFSVSDLAIIRAKVNEMGIGYQNLIQALVHNYATGKLKLEI